jgi:hypothetical protein
MRNSIDRNITNFITYFRDQLHLVETECTDTEDGHLHSKILYSAFLDAISRSVFDRQTHSVRYMRFITEFCDWPDCHRVSLPLILRLVKNKSGPEFAPLRDFTIQKMSNWMPGEQIFLDRDPLMTELELIWPSFDGKQLKINGLTSMSFQHRHLLYTYRNNLVHEFRIAGRRVELWNIDTPYYAHLSEFPNNDSQDFVRSWELQYTAKFFRRLCVSGLNNLEKHLLQYQIDPLLSIDWGNHWIRELNH